MAGENEARVCLLHRLVLGTSLLLPLCAVAATLPRLRFSPLLQRRVQLISHCDPSSRADPWLSVS